MLTSGREAGSAAAARVILVASRAAGGGPGAGLRRAFGMEGGSSSSSSSSASSTSSSSFNASLMFQHFAKPLANAVAAASDLDDGGAGSRGGRSHAARTALEALTAGPHPVYSHTHTHTHTHIIRDCLIIEYPVHAACLFTHTRVFARLERRSSGVNTSCFLLVVNDEADGLRLFYLTVMRTYGPG